jgi:hypothetical protein
LKTHDTYWPVKRVNYETDNDGNVVSDIVQAVPGIDDHVLVTQNNPHGDFHTPNGHAYTTYMLNRMYGEYLSGNSSTLAFRRLVQPSNSLPFPDFLNSDIAYNQALSRMFDSLRGQVDLSIAIAEAGQTVKMFKAVTKAVSYIRSFSPKNWGNKWLEYQYGWKPLLSDIYQSASQIRSSSNSWMRIQGTGSDRDEISSDVYSPESWPWSGGMTRKSKFNRSTRARFNCTFHLEDTTLQRLGNWTSLNPVSIAWELTPYSFVVDWFYDVGGYLRNLETAMLHNSSFHSGYLTIGQAVQGSGTESGAGYNGPYYYKIDLAGSYTARKFERTILQSMPFPRAPSFKAALGSQRLLSAASLLSQFLGRK